MKPFTLASLILSVFILLFASSASARHLNGDGKDLLMNLHSKNMSRLFSFELKGASISKENGRHIVKVHLGEEMVDAFTDEPVANCMWIKQDDLFFNWHSIFDQFTPNLTMIFAFEPGEDAPMPINVDLLGLYEEDDGWTLEVKPLDGEHLPIGKFEHIKVEID